MSMNSSLGSDVSGVNFRPSRCSMKCDGDPAVIGVVVNATLTIMISQSNDVPCAKIHMDFTDRSSKLLLLKAMSLIAK